MGGAQVARRIKKTQFLQPVDERPVTPSRSLARPASSAVLRRRTNSGGGLVDCAAKAITVSSPDLASSCCHWDGRLHAPTAPVGGG